MHCAMCNESYYVPVPSSLATFDLTLTPSMLTMQQAVHAMKWISTKTCTSSLQLALMSNLTELECLQHMIEST